MKLAFVRELPELKASIVESWLFNLVYSAQYVSIRFLSGRPYEWLTHVCARIRAWVLERKGAQVVIAQGVEPPLPRGAQVVWETYFLDDSPIGGDSEFRRGGSNMWVRAMERFGDKVAVIGVRGTASGRLLRQMFPEFAGKVHDLNYVHSEYQSVTEAEVRRKQSTPGPVRILFIGRAARRKGLVPLLQALTRLRADGVDNFTVTVVSDCVDGTVDFPDWVDRHVSVSHGEALRMMRESQIFIMPSFFESYGLVYLEALASGCVTFVPDREPQREFVDYGRAGCTVDPNDVPGMAEALRTVLSDPALRTGLALAGLQHYESSLSQRVVQEKWRVALASVQLGGV